MNLDLTNVTTLDLDPAMRRSSSLPKMARLNDLRGCTTDAN